MRRHPCVIALFLALILAFAGSSLAQTSSSPATSSTYYATSFNLWSITPDNANSYIFQGRIRCTSNAQNINFFTFYTNAPVFIQDQGNSSNNEVKTPSAIINTAGSCGVQISPSFSHFTFVLRSGTAGLQEALNNLSGATLQPSVVVLDKNWYAQAWQIPGTTPYAIIAAAAGSSNVIIQDITTAPDSYFRWDGSKYVSSAAPIGFPNLSVTSYTGISAPTALSTAAATNGLITTSTTGGTIPTGGAYRLAATYVDASGGETLISTDSAGTAIVTTGAGSTNSITVTSPAAVAGAVGWRLYMTAASGGSGTEILYSPVCVGTQLQAVFPTGTVCAIGSSATITAVVTGTATVPSIATAYPRSSGGSGSFPPFTALGTVTAASTGTLGVINLPAGYLNTLGRQITACGNGFATNNTTTGTVAISATMASVPGVTTITPFTASYTTATTTAVQVPFNFCVTFTTAAVGTSGTLEAHGWINARPATAGAGVAGVTVMDNIFAVSSTVDLTKQDQIALTITPTTTGLTAAQLRQLSIVPSN